MEARIIDLKMGPTRAMDLLKLGNYCEKSAPVMTANYVSGNYLHTLNGYGQMQLIHRKKQVGGLGVRLHAIGVPDEIDFENRTVVEFKTYRDRREIQYHMERGIFQCCFYCWMLGFDEFNKFRILFYNINTGKVDIEIERFADRYKFFKKLKKAVWLSIDEGDGFLARKRKMAKTYYWLPRYLDWLPQELPSAAAVKKPNRMENPEGWGKYQDYSLLMEYFNSMIS